MDANGCPSEYHAALDEHLMSLPAGGMGQLESAMLDAASRTGAVPDAQAGMSKPWLSARVQELIANRRATRNSAERARISKDIRKETRKGMRQYQTRVTEIVLQRFRGLDRIEHVRRQPVIRSSPMESVKPERFADYFEDVYASSHEPLLVDRAALAEVPPFTAEEVKRAACHMSNAKIGRAHV